MLGIALVAATIGVQLVDGSLQLEAGLTVLLLAPELYLPLRQVGAQFHASADGLAAAERIFDVLDAPAAVRGAGASRSPRPTRATAAIRLEDVALRHPGRDEPGARRRRRSRSARRDGRARRPSGAGKTHARRAAAAARRPRRGDASPAAGSTCATSTRAAWRRRVAWVPQRPTLFAGTVADNIRLADPGASDAAGARGRRGRRGARASWPTCPTGSTRGSATAAGSCRPARRSGSRSRARSCATRRCSCSTSRPRTSTEHGGAAVGAAIERLVGGAHGAARRPPPGAGRGRRTGSSPWTAGAWPPRRRRRGRRDERAAATLRAARAGRCAAPSG